MGYAGGYACAASLVTGTNGEVHPTPVTEVEVAGARELVALIDHATSLRSTSATAVHDGNERRRRRRYRHPRSHAHACVRNSHRAVGWRSRGDDADEHIMHAVGGGNSVSDDHELINMCCGCSLLSIACRLPHLHLSSPSPRCPPPPGAGWQQQQQQQQQQEEGCLTLVDLAGSEHKIDSMYHDAQRRKEGAQINSSLMASQAFPSWNRFMLTEIYRCHASSDHEFHRR
eukprot:SAG25_NODE_943_length_4654_cov_5.645225_3_plen_229_part_00